MENEQIADQILSALQQMLEAAGPEWTLQFLQAGIEEAGAGGQMQPEMMSQGGPQAMPMRPQAPRNALSGQ
jgi:actin-like ATPase involved in cell morphogenesis